MGPVLHQLCLPVFADTRVGTFNVSPENIRRAITIRTKAIIVAHLAGEPCEMDAIMEIANEHGLPVIEDVAQAHDATYRGRKCGSFGTLAAFSLMSGKHHTSGGQGGMVLTDDDRLYWRAKSFADRGKTFDRPGVGNTILGLNYRMTELEAAIGRVQMRKVSGFVDRRRALANVFSERLKESRIFSLGRIPEGAVSSYWYLRLTVNVAATSKSVADLTKAITARGVAAAGTRTAAILSQPWLLERNTYGKSQIPWSLTDLVYDYADCCPNAENALATHILIALNESMSEQTVHAVVDALLDVEAEDDAEDPGKINRHKLVR